MTTEPEPPLTRYCIRFRKDRYPGCVTHSIDPDQSITCPPCRAEVEAGLSAVDLSVDLSCGRMATGVCAG